MKIIKSIKEKLRLKSNAETYEGHPDQWFGSSTYSQHGEDILILGIFKLLGISHPSYLDVGAHHPINISNTALLYQKGSRGVNVEANPNLITAFIKARPEDINLNVGIANQSGEMDFYMIDDYSGRNTFNKNEAEKFVLENKNFKISKIVKIKTITINEVIRDYCKVMPDFLSIDVEGFDEQIIRSLDFSLGKPKVICVETVDAVGNYLCSLKDYLLQNGYDSLIRTGGNTLFVDNNYSNILR